MPSIFQRNFSVPIMQLTQWIQADFKPNRPLPMSTVELENLFSLTSIRPLYIILELLMYKPITEADDKNYAQNLNVLFSNLDHNLLLEGLRVQPCNLNQCSKLISKWSYHCENNLLDDLICSFKAANTSTDDFKDYLFKFGADNLMKTVQIPFDDHVEVWPVLHIFANLTHTSDRAEKFKAVISYLGTPAAESILSEMNTYKCKHGYDLVADTYRDTCCPSPTVTHASSFNSLTTLLSDADMSDSSENTRVLYGNS